MFKSFFDKDIFWVWFFLLITISVKSQVYPFQTYGLEDGLPSNRVNDFIQDSRGFYWLAIEGTGLVRYDGHEFITYEDASRPEWLLIDKIEEDLKGNIWASLQFGLLKFDGHKFKDYTLPISSKTKLFSEDNNILVVVSQDNQIWRLENEEWIKFPSPQEWKINSILLFKNKLWVATQNGLFIRELTSSSEEWKSISGESFLKLSSNRKSLFAVGQSELSQFDEHGDFVDRFNQALDFIFINELGSCGMKDRELILNWNDEAQKLTKSNGLPSGVSKCYIDDFGVLWLFGGEKVAKLESQSLKFFQGLSYEKNEQVNAVYIDDQGNWTAGLSSGIVENKSGELKSHNSESGFPFGLTLAIEQYGGKKWFGTEAGLIKESNGRYAKVDLPIPGDFVFSLKEVKDELWVATGSGLLSYRNARFENIMTLNDLPPATVYHISESRKDESVWCATYTQGFYRYLNNSWSVIKEINGNRFDSLRFSCFTAISESEIWAGSLTEGLFHITADGIDHINPSNLNFAEVHALEVDDFGNLWIGTNKGLMQMDAEGNILSIGNIKSLSTASTSSQAMKVKGDKLILGTSDGVVFIELRNFLKKRKAPSIALTGLEMFLGQNTGWQKFAQDSISFTLIPSKLELPHSLNFLSFNLSGLTSFENQRLNYRYRLKGQSNEWTYAEGRREAIISNIKPGKYVFEAQARRIGEEWSGKVINYPFEILRPVWKRWWFILLMSVFAASLITLFIYDRIKRLNQRLKLENELIDMERKALRLQMNPHFIFNALDSISSFIFKNDPRKAVQYLNNFAKLMRHTLESSMEHLHPVETEVSILKNYLELEKLRFQGKFDYEIELDDEIDYDVGIPPMLIQPHVENAILHGLKPMEANGKLDIRFILDDDMLEVQIEDNGVGRKKAKELQKRKDHRSMATKINKDRIELLKSAVNQNIEIRILDKEDSNKEALGTKVIIRLPAENI